MNNVNKLSYYFVNENVNAKFQLNFTAIFLIFSSFQDRSEINVISSITLRTFLIQHISNLLSNKSIIPNTQKWT